MRKEEKIIEKIEHCRYYSKYYCDHCKKLIKDNADAEMSYPPSVIEFCMPEIYFKNAEWSDDERLEAGTSYPPKNLMLCPECKKEFKNKVINESEIFKNNLENLYREFTIWGNN